ncbi:class I SAM-dependent rRNA methyltransferase [Desulfuromonas carbonis]|uniref:class I SAM-dependent rRNA methyltransferase n=1 Tax=Desulfuromonas sp. DDH964 TaxID=1823759 RepID=UPI00078D5C58|nr:class I SAM-dependent rRNA methyltransferase [Desulfuromonas sp. DDH964]AMV71676.1 SAM-dependent methyltransferase [Desulfuromonas sp. DDH964]
MKRRKCTVGAETVRMLELGHPWVIADRFTRSWSPGNVGDLIELCDEREKLLATALYDPGERIVARVLAPGRVELDAAWLERRLAAALALRRQHVDLEETDTYRLVNGEGDGLPGLTVDCYRDRLMIQLFTGAWQPYLPLLVQGLQKLLAPAGIYEKWRPQQTRELASGGEKHVARLLAGSAAPGRQPVTENGLTFLVELGTGLNTGLFLDQRENRRDLMGRVAGRTVLNLFAYTGAFSVAAAAAGASRVTSVDASGSYLDWAQENFGANRLNPKRHEFMVGDCFAVLDQLLAERRRFDLVLMDPPSFSTTAKNTFTTRGGTSALVAKALQLLPAGGLLVTSSNHQKVDVADYLKELRRGALAAGYELRVIGLRGQSGDFPYPLTFPEGRYLKYLLGVKG